MSTKLMTLFVGIGASLAFIAGSMQGCGGSSSGSGSDVALCEMSCDKGLACTPDAGSDVQAAAMQCKANCPATVAAMHCSNQAARANAFRSCLPMACEAFFTCAAAVPACQSTTGSGGTTGTGGSTGSGGTGGSGNGWTCYETAADGCSCVASPGGASGTCTATYNCCFSTTAGGTQTCSCVNDTAANCTAIISAVSGTKVADCPL